MECDSMLPKHSLREHGLWEGVSVARGLAGYAKGLSAARHALRPGGNQGRAGGQSAARDSGELSLPASPNDWS